MNISAPKVGVRLRSKKNSQTENPERSWCPDTKLGGSFEGE